MSVQHGSCYGSCTAVIPPEQKATPISVQTNHQHMFNNTSATSTPPAHSPLNRTYFVCRRATCWALGTIQGFRWSSEHLELSMRPKGLKRQRCNTSKYLEGDVFWRGIWSPFRRNLGFTRIYFPVPPVQSLAQYSSKSRSRFDRSCDELVLLWAIARVFMRR
jgi:hypothetical protein